MHRCRAIYACWPAVVLTTRRRLACARWHLQGKDRRKSEDSSSASEPPELPYLPSHHRSSAEQLLPGVRLVQLPPLQLAFPVVVQQQQQQRALRLPAAQQLQRAAAQQQRLAAALAPPRMDALLEAVLLFGRRDYGFVL